MPDNRISREDVISTVGARRELGDDMEPEVVDAFLQRVETAIDTRVETRLASAKQTREVQRHLDDGPGIALAVVSLGTGIPITAIAGDAAGIAGVIAAWAGIVGVNLAHSLRRH